MSLPAALPADHTHVELFFDPACPFCWVTSRWLEEVASHTGTVAVTYRPMALRMLNPDEDPAGPMGGAHRRGLELLRVAVAVGDAHGADAVARFYAAVGTAIHEVPVDDAEDFDDVARVQATRPEHLRGLLEDLDLPGELAAAADDPSDDARIEASTRTALERAGEDVGTPVVSIDPPDGPAFFGPILSQVPRGDDAVELFDAALTLARYRPFTEFKRSLRALPDVAAFATIR